jgi:hypothetical protein
MWHALRMADDWRVELDVEDHDLLHRALDRLRERGVARDARHRLGEGVVISVDADRIFAYAQTREQAQEAARVLAELAEAHHLAAQAAIAHWHPEEERWEREDVALPATAAQHEAEHERLEEDEAEESEQLGALWEVRIEFDSHRDALEMADRIESEADDLLAGYTVSVVRHWRYLLIGADNEDQALEIAEQVRDQLPAGAELKVEPSGALVWQAMKPSPFAVLGGLSG